MQLQQNEQGYILSFDTFDSIQRRTELLCFFYQEKKAQPTRKLPELGATAATATSAAASSTPTTAYSFGWPGKSACSSSCAIVLQRPASIRCQPVQPDRSLQSSAEHLLVLKTTLHFHQHKFQHRIIQSRFNDTYKI